MSEQLAEQSVKSKAEAFAEKMLGTINGAGLALMTSIGHRTGLFDAMAALAPADPARVAEAAGLNERYVREWLGAMTAGGVVEYDSGVLTLAEAVIGKTYRQGGGSGYSILIT